MSPKFDTLSVNSQSIFGRSLNGCVYKLYVNLFVKNVQLNAVDARSFLGVALYYLISFHKYFLPFFLSAFNLTVCMYVCVCGPSRPN